MSAMDAADRAYYETAIRALQSPAAPGVPLGAGPWLRWRSACKAWRK